MSACSFNGAVEATSYIDSSEMLSEGIEHNYEASAIDIVEQQEQEREREREREHILCSPPPNDLTGENDNNFNTLQATGKNTANSADSTVASTGVNSNSIISLMQTSPPPHSYRHSRAYRHFKNPPQPHMCIRTTTEAGEELFINVLSWTRIVIPQEPSDPIPLYGGMRVPPGSPRSPPIVFAVMANPEVLKDSGRHSKDPEERRAMVELMCDFVEAMNPGVKLVRNAVILKDRDISGELKDVWSAVQAQRDREREEQLLQQRQQQHFHNITTQQMFPKASDNIEISTLNGTSTQTALNLGQQQTQQYEQLQQQQQHLQNIDNNASMLISAEHDLSTIIHENSMTTVEEKQTENLQQTMKIIDNNHDQNVNATQQMEKFTTINEAKNISNIIDDDINTNTNSLNGNSNNENISGDQTDAAIVTETFNNDISEQKQLQTNNTNAASVAISTTTSTTYSANTNHLHNNHQFNNNSNNKKIVTTNATATPATSPTIAHTPNISETSTNNTTTQQKAITTSTTTTPTNVTTITSPTPKKDKLVNFLPNGCIFPRFKNNKNRDKDKDKEKEKESKNKDKEKTFMHALKKSKDKKAAANSEQNEKTATTITTTTTPDNVANIDVKQPQTLINLEHEVQKLDLGKDSNKKNNISSSSSNNDTNMFIKLKVPSSATTAK